MFCFFLWKRPRSNTRHLVEIKPKQTTNASVKHLVLFLRQEEIVIHNQFAAERSRKMAGLADSEKITLMTFKRVTVTNLISWSVAQMSEVPKNDQGTPMKTLNKI